MVLASVIVGLPHSSASALISSFRFMDSPLVSAGPVGRICRIVPRCVYRTYRILSSCGISPGALKPRGIGGRGISWGTYNTCARG
jgi:hypothetical protein